MYKIIIKMLKVYSHELSLPILSSFRWFKRHICNHLLTHFPVLQFVISSLPKSHHSINNNQI